MTNKVQVSYSEGRDGRIFVVGGDTAEEFELNATALLGADKASRLIEDFQLLVNPSVAAAVQAAAPIRTGSGAAGATQQQPAAPAQAAPGAPSCAHGARTFRSGQGKKGPWTAYFCPLPSDRKSEQCEAIWG